MSQFMHMLLALWGAGALIVGLLFLFCWSTGTTHHLRKREWLGLFCWLPVVIACGLASLFLWVAEKGRCG